MVAQVTDFENQVLLRTRCPSSNRFSRARLFKSTGQSKPSSKDGAHQQSATSSNISNRPAAKYRVMETYFIETTAVSK